MSSDIIQLKQSDGHVNQDPATGEALNGDYSVDLPQKIVISQGDSLVVKNSFIDTQASNSAKITVLPNTQMTTKNYLYINDIVTTGGVVKNLDATNRTDFTGEPFIACEKKAGAGVEIRQVNKITLHITQVPDPGTGEPSDTEYLKFTYYDVNNDLQSYRGSYTIDSSDQIGDKTVDIGTTINFRGGTDITLDTGEWSVTYMKKPVLSDLGWSDGGSITPYPGRVENLNDVYEPIILTNTIDVPAGNYDPQNLITLLNTETQLNTPTAANFMNTPYLCITDNSVPAKLRLPDGTLKEVFFFNADVTDGFTIDGSAAIVYVGTDNFAFGYEPTQSQFTIDYIHMPYINNADGSRAVALVKTTEIGNNNPGDYKLMNSYGGIFFNDISDNNGLLTTAMGFDTNSLKVSTTSTDFDILGIQGKAPKLNQALELQKNITGQLVTMNSFVDKRAGQTFYIPPVDVNNKITQTFFSQSPDTYQILANPSEITKTFNFGYFLIEIEAKFPTKLYTTENTFKFIKQIVGRYYEANSFTQGESGQIVYTHQSPDPLYLNSFRVRILNPSYQVPSGLGSHSAVFLEHVKAQAK